MNRDSIVFNLDEALEELTRTLDDVKNRKGYTENDLRTAMEHLYHHLNFAWNTRNSAPDDVNNLSDASFYAWRAFPSDIDMSDPYKAARTKSI